MCAVCEFTNHRTSECEQENATTFKMSKSILPVPYTVTVSNSTILKTDTFNACWFI